MTHQCCANNSVRIEAAEGLSVFVTPGYISWLCVKLQLHRPTSFCVISNRIRQAPSQWRLIISYTYKICF